MAIGYILVSLSLLFTIDFAFATLIIINVCFVVIILENTEGTSQFRRRQEIRIASSVGNEELRTSEGENINCRLLIAGGLIEFVNEGNAQSSNRMTLLKRLSGTPWSDDFHVFEIEWKSGSIIAKVDGVQYGEQVIDESFGKSVLKFYYIFLCGQRQPFA